MSGIVLGYDDSPAARAAMQWAAAQAALTEVEVIVVYVLSSVVEWELAAVQVNPDPIRHEFERRLREDWSSPLRQHGIRHRTTVAVGRVADQLIHVAQDASADLIVIGMTTHGSLAELANKSTLRQLRGHAVRPVVAVPAEWASVAG